VDGVYGPRTQATVRSFQEIFGLVPDGIVGPATWNAIVRLYTAVNRLAELRSQGQQFYAINWTPPQSLQLGSTGDKVRQLQYMLSILSDFIPGIPPLVMDGIYGPATRNAVLAAQRRFGLPETGATDAATWLAIYDQFSGIETAALRSEETFPRNGNTGQPSPMPRAVQAANFRNNNRRMSPPSTQQVTPYRRSTLFTQFPGMDLTLGMQDPISQEVVR
jgi:peptidoglycan hydrolase-like protein with peptidoglycan-binding domain